MQICNLYLYIDIYIIYIYTSTSISISVSISIGSSSSHVDASQPHGPSSSFKLLLCLPTQPPCHQPGFPSIHCPFYLEGNYFFFPLALTLDVSQKAKKWFPWLLKDWKNLSKGETWVKNSKYKYKYKYIFKVPIISHQRAPLSNCKSCRLVGSG